MLRLVVRGERGCSLEKRDASAIGIILHSGRLVDRRGGCIEVYGVFAGGEVDLGNVRSRGRYGGCQLYLALLLFLGCFVLLSELLERSLACVLEERRRAHVLVVLNLYALQSGNAPAHRLRVEVIRNDSLPALLVL